MSEKYLQIILLIVLGIVWGWINLKSSVQWLTTLSIVWISITLPLATGLLISYIFFGWLT